MIECGNKIANWREKMSRLMKLIKKNDDNLALCVVLLGFDGQDKFNMLQKLVHETEAIVIFALVLSNFQT